MIKRTKFEKVMGILFLTWVLGCALGAIVVKFIPSLNKLTGVVTDLKLKYNLIEDSDRYEVTFYGKVFNNSGRNYKDCRVTVVVRTDNPNKPVYDYTLYCGYIAKHSEKPIEIVDRGGYKPTSVSILQITEGSMTEQEKLFIAFIAAFAGGFLVFGVTSAIYSIIKRKKLMAQLNSMTATEIEENQQQCKEFIEKESKKSSASYDEKQRLSLLAWWEKHCKAAAVVTGCVTFVTMAFALILLFLFRNFGAAMMLGSFSVLASGAAFVISIKMVRNGSKYYRRENQKTADDIKLKEYTKLYEAYKSALKTDKIDDSNQIEDNDKKSD